MESTPSRFVVRVWLPDRPGALGAVASRIGAVRGDVISVDVLERGGGRAVDEVTVEIPDVALIDLLVSEIGEVDGVDVEDVRGPHTQESDRAVAALAVARAVVAVDDTDDLHRVACRRIRELLGATWVAVVDRDHQRLLATAGEDAPSDGWLVAFVSAAQSARGAVDELSYCLIGAPSATYLVVSRTTPPLRTAERRVLEELAALVAHREGELLATGGLVSD